MFARLIVMSFVVFAAQSAFADVVMPPPTQCPPGATPETGHGGPHCAPLDCQQDSDCGEGLACQAQPLCIKESTFSDSRETSIKQRDAASVCASDNKCDVGVCEAQKRCIPGVKSSSNKATAPGANQPKKNKLFGGCAASGEQTSSLPWGLFLLALLWRKRRAER